jgi:hypothetical protein
MKALWLLVPVLAVAFIGIAVAYPPVPTTRVDFFEPGTQPMTLQQDLVDANTCSFCHAGFNPASAPFDRWRTSLMAQAARDPVFHAALAIAEHDAAFAGDTCWRCHSPVGWLRGHVAAPNPTDGSALAGDDLEGVSCSICHRMVNPVYAPGIAPSEDEMILAELSPPALADAHSGSYVIDPKDRRRGPFDLDTDWQDSAFGGWPNFHAYLQSPFHRQSALCASCHDVSLPHYTKQTDGSYALNTNNEAGPAKHLQFPEQRTYSEWANSLFATGPVELGGRFGGTRGTAVASCQDCHMPGVEGHGCGIADPPLRHVVPQHNFNGANTWVLRAIREIYPDPDTYLDEQGVDDAIARTHDMLAKASDLELYHSGNSLVTRIVNFTGHKLPTGYPEGRRMWINVRFLNAMGGLLAERGRYDDTTATLIAAGDDTKVYEAVHGIDSTIAGLTGLPEGPLFRLALVNKKYKDNRIPPMGFTNAAFAAAGAAPVPAGLYADGQYWDDTIFAIPSGATRAEVRVYYQTSTKEYMEFLRDAIPPAPGHTDPCEPMGQTKGELAYCLWDSTGKSAPALMDVQVIDLACPADFDHSTVVDPDDLFSFLDAWFAQNGQSGTGLTADLTGDFAVDADDLFAFLDAWFAGCTP